MGLFSKLPEEPVEWAGLPSEPTHPETAAERLNEAATLDAGGLGLGDVAIGGIGAVESIVIPVAPVIEIAQSHGTDEDE